ncbi:MAG: hypothetical protein KY469_06330 [Actinobacteria bacterium]|nr:hypothetical protein [Actinomycetota bacterium]
MGVDEIWPQLREFLATSDEAERVLADVERVAGAHGWAMACAQLFEVTVRFSAPAAAAADADDDSAARMFAAALKRGLFAAVEELEQAWPADLEVPEDLRARLDTARETRNYLAHDFWLVELPRLLGGHADVLGSELQTTADEFLALAQDLIQVLLSRVAEQRGVSRQALGEFTTFLITTMIHRPESVAGLDIWRDGEELVDRLADLVDELQMTSAQESGENRSTAAGPLETDPSRDVDVVQVDGRRIVQWTITDADERSVVIRHDSPDALVHHYAPCGPNEDLPLFQGEFTFSDESETVEPWTGEVAFSWAPSPRVVAQGARHANVEDLNALLEAREPGWVSNPTVELREAIPPVPPPPMAGERAPSDGAARTTASVNQRLGAQQLGAGRGVERVTFLVPNGWWCPQGTLVCDPADRRTRWPSRLVVPIESWELTLDSRREASQHAYWKERKGQGGYDFTQIGQLRRVDGTSFDSAQALVFLEAIGLGLSFAVGRSTATLLPVGWIGDTPTWTSWHEAPVDRLWSAGTWLDERLANEQLSELLPLVVGQWKDPLRRDVLRYAISYYLTANVDVNAELIVAIATSGLQLLAYHRFVESSGDFSRKAWKKVPTEQQLRTLLDDSEIPTAVPPHLAHLANVAEEFHCTSGDDVDALTCIIRLRNHVVHPKHAHRAARNVYEWAEAGFVALHYLELALLNELGYQGKVRSRIGNADSGTLLAPVPWATP